MKRRIFTLTSTNQYLGNPWSSTPSIPQRTSKGGGTIRTQATRLFHLPCRWAHTHDLLPESKGFSSIQQRGNRIYLIRLSWGLNENIYLMNLAQCPICLLWAPLSQPGKNKEPYAQVGVSINVVMSSYVQSNCASPDGLYLFIWRTFCVIIYNRLFVCSQDQLLFSCFCRIWALQSAQSLWFLLCLYILSLWLESIV